MTQEGEIVAIIETPCPHCMLDIELGQEVALFKLATGHYCTGHIMCPQEQDKLKELYGRVRQTQEKLNQVSQPRTPSRGWLSRLFRK